MTRVSVIVPCYNRASLVAETIESALAQDHPDIEVIVVDDGSTDESWQVIESFRECVRGIRVPNGGVALARNIGLARATGTLVKFLDSDDLLEPGAVPAQIADLAGLPEGTIPVGTARCIDREGRPLDWEKYRMPCPADGSPVPRAALLTKVIQCSFPLFPATALRAVGGFRVELSMVEDHDLVLRLWHAGWRFALFPTPSTMMREHAGDRLTHGTAGRLFRGMSMVYREHIRAFESAPEGPLIPAERVALARRLWLLGRVAAKGAARAEARGLFTLADELGGRQAWVASWPLRQLYRVLSPVAAERLVTLGRRALGRP